MKSRCALVFFVRNPVPGKVKTRLAAGIGDQAACELYACFVRDMLAMLESTGQDILIMAWPPHEVDLVEGCLKNGHKVYPQKGESLGEKMKNALVLAFDMGYDQALLMGSDIPDLPARAVTEAIQYLEENDCVLGPSEDGGYYLVGFRKTGFCPDIFFGPEWGASNVLEQTLSLLNKNQASFGLAKPWRDVDDTDDLAALHLRLSTGITQAKTTWNRLKELVDANPYLLHSTPS